MKLTYLFLLIISVVQISAQTDGRKVCKIAAVFKRDTYAGDWGLTQGHHLTLACTGAGFNGQYIWGQGERDVFDDSFQHVVFEVANQNDIDYPCLGLSRCVINSDTTDAGYLVKVEIIAYTPDYGFKWFDHEPKGIPGLNPRYEGYCMSTDADDCSAPTAQQMCIEGLTEGYDSAAEFIPIMNGASVTGCLNGILTIDPDTFWT